MKRSKAFLFLFAFSIISISLIFSAPYAWKSVIAGGGGFVDGIVFHPTQQNLGYARTDMGGAYRWNGTTQTWTPITDMFGRNDSDRYGILSIAIDPEDATRVYMETGKYTASWAGNGVFLASADQGNTWTTTNLSFKVGGNEDGRGTGERLMVDPNLGTTIFMGTTVNGLWKSADRGNTWNQVTSFTQTDVDFVLFDKSTGTTGSATKNIYVGVNSATTPLYLSTDGGATWNPLTGEPTGLEAIRADINANLIYFTFANYVGPNNATTGAVWKYNTSNGVWTNITPETSPTHGYSGISIDQTNPNNIVLSTLDCWWPIDQVWRSTNQGASWTPLMFNTSNTIIASFDSTYAPYASITKRTPSWLADIKIDPFNSNRAIFTTGYGLWVCNNLPNMSNTTWAFEDNTIEETVPMQIISPPSGAYLLSAMGDVDGFEHTTLDTSPASGNYSPGEGTTLSIDFAQNVPLKIVKAFNNTGYGSYSADGGTTWTLFGSAPSGTSGGGTKAIAISPNGTNIVWAPAGASMSYSNNNGSSWTACGGGAPSALCPVSDRVNSNKFYVYDAVNGALWISTNAGAAFTKSTYAFPVLPSYLAGDGGAYPVFSTEGDLWITCGSNGLYHSTDSGATATKIGTVTEAYLAGFGKALNTYPSIYIWGIISGQEGFYRSDDEGLTWTRINDNTHQYGTMHCITGDQRTYGRCYISFEGRGIIYGDIPAAGTPTFTPTYTPSRTPTFTATRTASPTFTRSFTPTFTSTQQISSPTFTPTFTITATNTRSFTSTFTSTQQINSPSFTPTFTATATNTRSFTPTFTSTQQINSPTFTYSVTSSQTLTFSPTATQTASWTATSTQSMTSTATQTSTQYAGTPTITETSTACACATYAGNATIGTYETFNYTSPTLDTNSFTMTQDGVINALEIYVASTSGGNIEMALYSDSNGSPGTLISASAAQGSVAGWNVVNIPSTMVPAGTYWIAWQLSPDVYVTADVGITGDDQWIAQPFGAFPGSISAPNEFNFVASVKADYCPISCVGITPTPIPECMCAAQFGMQYEGSNAIGPMSGFASATWYGMSEDGIATSMEVFIYQGSGNARVAIYSNSLTTTAAGVPDKLICESQPFAVTTGWNTVAIPQVFLAVNTVYWLVFECDDPSIYVAADSGNNGDIYFRTQAFGEYPEEFTNATSAAFDDSILVNYCPLSCPPTPTVTETVSETVTETPSMAATKTMTMTPTNMINSPTVTAMVSVTQTYTYTQTFTATATEQVSPSNTPVTPVNTATQSPTQQATATYTTTPQAAATATATTVGAATATATMTAGVVPIPYPNPAKPGTDDIKMNVTVEKAASEIKFLMFTPGYRLVREKSLGSYPQGIMQVDLDKADFKGMANSVYYFIIDKKYSDGTSAVTKPGKIILIN